MREIKFRAWDKKNTIMFYLNEVSSSNSCVDGSGICWHNKHAYMTWHGNCYENGKHQDYTMLEYTGLKDKNDKEIYEGDVVEFEKVNIISNHDINPYRRVVKWAKDRPELRFYTLCGNEASGFILASPSCERHFEVIGNIYENPELLNANNVKNETSTH